MNKRIQLIQQIKDLLNGTQNIQPEFFLVTANNGLLYDDKDIEVVTWLMRFTHEHEFLYWKNSAGVGHTSYEESITPPCITCVLKTEYVPLPGAIPKRGKTLATAPAYSERQQQLEALAAQYEQSPPKYFVIERSPFSTLGGTVEHGGRIIPAWLKD